jgi:proteasome lid subunit RPN8/RPN11
MKKKRAARVLLSTSAWKTMLLDARGRQEIEACGALLGSMDEEGNWHVEEALPLRNIYASPVYFEFDPADLLAIDLEQPGRMVGVYHSHPVGPAVASSTDRQNMQRVNGEQQIPWVWLILSGPFSGSSADESTNDDERHDDGNITAHGLRAYHYYQDIGLQQVAIQRVEDEHPGSAPRHDEDQ